MKIAIYSRVSKDNGSQSPENKLQALRDYANALQGEIVDEYVDYASGGNGDRKDFLRMLHDAERRKFDLILVWALDRFSREGMFNTLGYIKRIRRNKVGIKSLQEPMFDFTDDGLGEVLVAFYAWVAAQERKRIIERTKSGLQRARSQGKKLGRPLGKKDGKVRRKSGYYRRWDRSREKAGVLQGRR